MAKLKQDLQQVTKQLKALAKKTESLLKVVDKLDKKKPAKKSKATTKAKPKRKNVSAKKATKKKATTKKKIATDSPASQVLKIIKRSKKGVHVSALMEKTGFGEGSVRNIVYKATKAGQIKRTGRGVYAGT